MPERLVTSAAVVRDDCPVRVVSSLSRAPTSTSTSSDRGLMAVLAGGVLGMVAAAFGLRRQA